MFVKPSPYKRNGRWYARVAYTDDNGKHHTPSLKAGRSFKTKKEALDYSDKHKFEVVTTASNEDINISLIDYYNRWAAAYKLPGAATRTKQRYGSRIPHSIERYFHNQPLKKVTRTDYQKFINWFGLIDHDGHVYDTIAKVHNTIKNVVKLAIAEGIITKDFTQGAQLKSTPGKKRVVEYLNFKELQQVKKATLKKRNPRFTGRYMILTIIYTGMRKEEIQALTWDDLDFENHTISINKAYLDSSHELGPTKTKGSNRVIDVDPKLFEYLQELRANNTKFVFQIPWGHHTIPTSNALGKLTESILADCGLKKKHFTFYSFRHVFTAVMIYKKLDLYSLSQYLGNSVAILQQYYAYELKELKAETAAKIVKITSTF